MNKKLRKLPPVCLFIASYRLLTGNLRLTRKHGDAFIDLNKRGRFKVFRHISIYPPRQYQESCVFMVSFKFARLSHRANKVTSFIPMLLIAGFPGFIQKFYAVNPETGFWLGMYQWQSPEYLEAYKDSFVFGMMKKRTVENSIEMKETGRTDIYHLLQQNALTE